MSRLQHLFLLIAIPIGLVQSWDIAITIGDQIQFYPKQNQTGSEGTQFRDLTALAYDAVHNILLFVEKQSDNASIFSYNLATKKYQSLVKRRPSENIQGVAFDPVKGLIFWTDFNERSIFYISLTHGSENNFYGKLLIKMDDDLPRGIAVDSCRGYIYWTNTNNTRPTIERARFDGSERKVIVNTNLFMPVSLAIDQRTKRLYWADDKEGIHYSIESSDLDGNDRITLLSGIDHYPNSITVSKDSIYWVDWGYHKIWTIPKTPSGAVKPQQYISFDNEPFGVVANYTIEDQIEGIPECEILADLYKNKTPFDDTYNVPADAGLFCVHGVKIFDKLECKCTAGYTGDRCDISVCNNYCYRGRCNVTGEGKPMCSCEEGFTGIRCEIEMCHNYCLNKGICTINDKKDPICACSGDFEGSRCESLKPSPTVSTPKPLPTTETITTDTQLLPEAVTCNCNEGNGSKKCETELCYNYCLNNGICSTNYKNEPVCTCSGDFEGSRCENVRLIPTSTTSKTVPTTVMTTTDMQPLPEITCNCTKENSTTLAATYNLDNVNEVYSLESSSCNDGWDTFSHPAFMVLAITCGLLCVVCVVLVTKIMQLKKRPRIKKRIIVNKNVTPMTARPDQCEITIENCCNMNICETPCFEPRSTIRPTLINSKSGKEEKKNLISNMEGPDDY